MGMIMDLMALRKVRAYVPTPSTYFMVLSLYLGHGKFFLGDSGYYEGNFCHGEIEGHGYKVFGISKATYTGQFHAGEMHGQGLLRKPDGEQYEGSWVEGKRSGECWMI